MSSTESTPEVEAITKSQFLSFLDAAINSLAMVVAIIPGKIDDLALSCIKWLRNDETFLAWLDRYEPAPAGAMTLPPPELTEAIGRWRRSEGIAEDAVPAGGWMQLVSLVLQIIAWVKSRQAPAPA